MSRGVSKKSMNIRQLFPQILCDKESRMRMMSSCANEDIGQTVRAMQQYSKGVVIHLVVDGQQEGNDGIRDKNESIERNGKEKEEDSLYGLSRVEGFVLPAIAGAVDREDSRTVGYRKRVWQRAADHEIAAFVHDPDAPVADYGKG